MQAKACGDNDASLPQHINCEKIKTVNSRQREH